MSTESPRTSIVVPAYNRAHVLARTLDSVLAQSDPSWELVVSDDGSTDETLAVANSYADRDARISVITSDNGGVALARNRGLEATDPTSEFVVFLDSDDRWFDSTLATLIAALAANPAWVSAYGLARCIDGDDRLIPGDDMEERMRERFEYRGRRLVQLGPEEPTTFASIVHHNYPVTPGLHLIRRPSLDEIGDFDPDVDPADDWDLAVRLGRSGPIGFVDELVLEWRRHPGTLSDTSPHHRSAYFRVLAKSLRAPHGTRSERATVRQVYLDDIAGSARSAFGHVRAPRQALRDLGRATLVTGQLLRAEAGRMTTSIRGRS